MSVIYEKIAQNGAPYRVEETDELLVNSLYVKNVRIATVDWAVSEDDIAQIVNSIDSVFMARFNSISATSERNAGLHIDQTVIEKFVEYTDNGLPKNLSALIAMKNTEKIDVPLIKSMAKEGYRFQMDERSGKSSIEMFADFADIVGNDSARVAFSLLGKTFVQQSDNFETVKSVIANSPEIVLSLNESVKSFFHFFIKDIVKANMGTENLSLIVNGLSQLSTEQQHSLTRITEEYTNIINAFADDPEMYGVVKKIDDMKFFYTGEVSQLFARCCMRWMFVLYSSQDFKNAFEKLSSENIEYVNVFHLMAVLDYIKDIEDDSTPLSMIFDLYGIDYSVSYS